MTAIRTGAGEAGSLRKHRCKMLGRSHWWQRVEGESMVRTAFAEQTHFKSLSAAGTGSGPIYRQP